MHAADSLLSAALLPFDSAMISADRIRKSTLYLSLAAVIADQLPTNFVGGDDSNLGEGG
jgi:hypothetical protein